VPTQDRRDVPITQLNQGLGQQRIRPTGVSCRWWFIELGQDSPFRGLVIAAGFAKAKGVAEACQAMLGKPLPPLQHSGWLRVQGLVWRVVWPWPVRTIRRARSANRCSVVSKRR
jgi:hypothetical protein